MRFPTSRVQSFWMTGPLDESITCFLIKMDPWVLVPITFRGLYVLAIRGLHILAYRGLHALAFRRLHVLIFSVLHIHTLREYKFLGHPLILEGDQLCKHIQRGRLSRIYYAYRGKISPVPLQKDECGSCAPTWIWMTLLFSNILPGDHNANLPLQMYRWVAPTRRPVDPKKSNRALGFPALVTGLCQSYRVPVSPARSCHRDIGIAPTRRLVDPKKSNRALGFPALVTGLWIAPTRHPVDPKKSNRALGFPALGSRPQDTQWTRRSPTGSWSCQALITGLCQFYGVPVAPNKIIRAPTNRAFIKKYCVPRQTQGETPQQPGDGRQRATDARPSPLEFTSAHPQKG
ncbi:hypothetical protein HKD37_14G040024 [Glycine soja]